MTYRTRTSSAYWRSNAYDAVSRIAQQLPARYEPRAARARYDRVPPRLYEGARVRDVVLGTGAAFVRISPDYALFGFWKEHGSRVEFIPCESAAGETIGEAFGLLGLPVPRRAMFPR